MFAVLKMRIRMYLFRRRLRKSKNSIFQRGVLFALNKVVVGQYCYVGPGAYWNAIGGIELKDGVIIGPRSFFWTENHDYRNVETTPYGGENIRKPIIIEECVWIGGDVRICPGVVVHRGAVIAMGSVVTKDVEAFTIVGGNPARVIGRRPNEAESMEMIKLGRFYMKKKLGMLEKQ